MVGRSRTTSARHGTGTPLVCARGHAQEPTRETTVGPPPVRTVRPMDMETIMKTSEFAAGWETANVALTADPYDTDTLTALADRIARLLGTP